MRIIHRKFWLYGELSLFTLGVPLALWLLLPPRAILPVMWAMTLVCYLIIRAVTHASERVIWGASAVRWVNLKPVLLRFALSAALLTAATWWLLPGSMFEFVRARPQLWAMVMVLYPLISVVPQEIIFRSYLFARFAPLLSPAMLVAVSGLGFGFAHIVFGNWVAPVLCAIGGVMFALTYQKHRSLLLACIEHALYGNFVFTLGLGRYFYHGAVAAAH
ncbi:MAG: CPBP family intramembrane glutamic endopeptidase [Pseudomonadota bacterium]